MANTYGFQYIITMNSDAIPTDYPPELKIENFVLEDYVTTEKLTDDPNGGLFGTRLEINA
jgi:uncharacterized protein YydD (DUF2326 family)